MCACTRSLSGSPFSTDPINPPIFRAFRSLVTSDLWLAPCVCCGMASPQKKRLQQSSSTHPLSLPIHTRGCLRPQSGVCAFCSLSVLGSFLWPTTVRFHPFVMSSLSLFVFFIFQGFHVVGVLRSLIVLAFFFFFFSFLHFTLLFRLPPSFLDISVKPKLLAL